jgi:predicted translin family RNA/ssDNA-binding protein
MIDNKDFSVIKDELESFDEGREFIINAGREITRLSKQAIYAVHRNDPGESLSLLDKAGEQVKKIIKVAKGNPLLLSTGSYSASLQEYVEARCYYDFCVHNKITTMKELGVDAETYLLGLCDLTGEMERRAVHSVIQGKPEEVKKIWIVVNEVYEKFLSLTLKNGELRKKSDSIKWNLKRIEEILYDLNIRKKNGIQGSAEEN